jgi:hypothetical protein
MRKHILSGELISKPEEKLSAENVKTIFDIEEPRSNLRGMFCRSAVLRIDRKKFCLN